MAENRLIGQLVDIGRRRSRCALWLALTRCWTVSALLLLAVMLTLRPEGHAARTLLAAWTAATLALALVFIRSTGRQRLSSTDVARELEADSPKLRDLLVTAAEQAERPPDGGYLEARLIDEALASHRRSPWEQKGIERLFLIQSIHHAALLFLVVVVAALWIAAPNPAPGHAAARQGVEVKPGNIELERGQPLLVSARFGSRPPSDITLLVSSNGATPTRWAMRLLLDDPVAVATVPAVHEDVRYWVEYSGRRTAQYRASVFDFPKAERVGAVIRSPAYTRLADRSITNASRLQAVRGAAADLTVRANKPLAEAWLEQEDGRLAVRADVIEEASVQLHGLALNSNQVYRLRLRDREGRTNAVPRLLTAEVYENTAPDIKLVLPRGDQRVSPLQEVLFRAQVRDDFGVLAHGITYSLSGQSEQSLSSAVPTAPGERRTNEFLLRLEDLKLQPGQVFSYYAWADDLDEAGQLRRTKTDLFLAEVRPLEEIFREASASDSASSESAESASAGGESEQIAELQKQNLSATWRLLNRSAAKRSTGSDYEKDRSVIDRVQQNLLTQALQLQEKAEDNRQKESLEAAERAMRKAVEQLSRAKDKPAALAEAAAAEQTAYEALVKNAPREQNVARSRQRSRGGNAASRSRQLEQLEFSQEDHRYENERQASAPQDPAKQEQQQLLNQLKELARRREDLNQQLRELSAANRPESERSPEVTERLKRLREQEQDFLSDLDELMDRTDPSRNAAAPRQAREQLQSARDSQLQTMESLDESQLGQALANGTRAGQNLQQLSQQLRQDSSQQLADDLRQLRQNARELTRREQDLGRQLEQARSETQRSLRPSADREALASELKQQDERLGKLLEQMAQVSTAAETAEPLVSRSLYDTLRQSAQSDTRQLQETSEELNQAGQLTRGVYEILQSGKQESKRPLAVSSELLQLNRLPEASLLEQKARQQLEGLTAAVDSAAAKVVGDDLEGLRAARDQLQRLTQQLERDFSSNAVPGEPPAAGDAALAGVREVSRRQNATSDGRGGSLGNTIERLREMEEVLEGPDLQRGAATARERAQDMYRGLRRYARYPQWDTVRSQLVEPLTELRGQVVEELARRTPNAKPVPIDRDPVPQRFSDSVRRYYENLARNR